MTVRAASTDADSPAAGIPAGMGLMILAMMITPLVDVFSKLATTTASPTSITAARFLIQVLCMLPFVIWTGSWRRFSWQLSLYHAIRAAVTTISMVCFVATLAVMEVADAVAIFFVEPIILTILSGIFLKEVIGWRRYSACAIGFLGAMIVIRPSFQDIGLVALLPVVTAFGVAIFALMTRALAHREDPWAMQFQMSLWGLPICAVLLAIGQSQHIGFLRPSLPDPTTLSWMTAVGVLASLSGILAIYAFRAAPASVIAPLQYFEIVSATLFGWLVFHDFPDPVKWLGIAIIVGSGLFIIWRERRAASKQPVTGSADSTAIP